MPDFLLLLAGALLVALPLWLRGRFWSFAAQRPEDYLAGTPIDLHRHLNGKMICEGVIYGPAGRVVSRFVADMEGRWQGSRGQLIERFHFDSGTVQDRVWDLTLGPDGRIAATAPDMPNGATGQVRGSGMLMRYDVRLMPEAGGHLLSVTDWMHLAPNGTLVNRSQFRKFGLKVAELVAVIRPAEGARDV
ncbi:DUF3833 family protein [Gemmobacter denitrificans]|uniref:DUF3833 family protein n=1 Tax=Gemmobacter denitrificans TaxID=3123040 RepID=A0ABU8BSU9_9RHOB